MFSVFNRRNNMMFLVVSLCFWGASFALISVVANYFVQKETVKIEKGIRSSLALVRSNFEAAIYMDTYLADSLSTVITIDTEFATKNWSSIASKLIRKSRFVRNVSLAPNNVISHVYPLEGNKGAIGFDLATRPEQIETVLQAKRQQSVVIAGPVELVQGGVGLIARFPIFSDYPNNRDYWGSVSVVMDYTRLEQSSGLMELEGAQVALRRLSLNGEKDVVFYGEETLFDAPDVIHQLHLPSVTWELAAKIDTASVAHIKETRRLSVLTGIVTTLLLYVLILMLYRNYTRVHQASLHDELTLLPNRRFITRMLTRLIDQNGTPRPFALLNIDLNDFKQVNDTLGHEAGDALLKHVAQVLLKAVRSTDTVARFGGDEFTVLVRNVSRQPQIERIIADIYAAMASSSVTWNDREITPSLSIGYTTYNGQKATVQQLLSEADDSMYQNKKRQKRGEKHS